MNKKSMFRKMSMVICLYLGLSLIIPVNLFSETPAAKSSAQDTPYKSSFAEVTSQLDPGGNVYAYMSTEQLMKTIEEFISGIKTAMQKKSGKENAGDDGSKYLDIFSGILKKSGLTEISGIGFSSLPIKDGLNRTKFVVHHYKDQGNGLIWQLNKPAPHKLDLLEMLPADTVLSGFGDFRLNAIWDWVVKEIEASNMPELKEKIEMVTKGTQSMGMDVSKLLGSISEGMGYALVLDSAKKCKLSPENPALEIPIPHLAFILPTADDTLSGLLTMFLQKAKKTESKGVTRFFLDAKIDLPFPVQPVLVKANNMLILASDNEMVDLMFAAKEKKNGLMATAEFKKLSQGIPLEGNSFSYTGSRLSQTIMNFIKVANAPKMEVPKEEKPVSKKDKKKAEKKAPKAEVKPAKECAKTCSTPCAENTGAKSEDESMMELFSTFMPKEWSSFCVMQHTSEGIVYTTNHTMSFEKMTFLAATIGAGVAAAVIIPKMMNKHRMEMNMHHSEDEMCAGKPAPESHGPACCSKDKAPKSQPKKEKAPKGKK